MRRGKVNSSAANPERRALSALCATICDQQICVQTSAQLEYCLVLSLLLTFYPVRVAEWQTR